jgi:ABC-type sugar transport system permease subunit
VLAWYTYRAAFQPPFNIGLGAASAWVLALILAVAGVAYARLIGRRADG